jgi:PIN domain nuclease of toxin-antitoxin system
MSRLLLDTHALLWWLADDPELSEEARRSIADPDAAVFVSAASAWEVAIKRALGRLEAPDDLSAALDASGIRAMPITITHAEAAGALPPHHADPFDRMLVAQARAEGLTIVTRDPAFAAYAVATLEA